MNLKDRCREFLDETEWLTHADPIGALADFVTAETGRLMADGALGDKALPLCLYFKTDAERDEFIRLVLDANPNLTARKTI